MVGSLNTVDNRVGLLAIDTTLLMKIFKNDETGNRLCYEKSKSE